MVLEAKQIDFTVDPFKNREKAIKFDSKWVENTKFSPLLSRSEAIISILGFQPAFSKEKRILLEIVHKTKEQSL